MDKNFVEKMLDDYLPNSKFRDKKDILLKNFLNTERIHENTYSYNECIKMGLEFDGIMEEADIDAIIKKL